MRLTPQYLNFLAYSSGFKVEVMKRGFGFCGVRGHRDLAPALVLVPERLQLIRSVWTPKP